MANTFELIASSTVGSGGAASINFASIPSTYTDLAVFTSTRSTATGSGADFFTYASFNGLTTNRTYRRVEGYNGLAGSDSGSNYPVGVSGGSTTTADLFSNGFFYVPNYSSTTINKSYSADWASTNNSTINYDLGFIAGLWSSTAAINQITITVSTGNLAQYSSAYLYGVKNA
jgi:hypothetical protein